MGDKGLMIPGAVDVKTGETDRTKYCIEIRDTSDSEKVIGYLPLGLSAEDKQRMKENDELRSKQLQANRHLDILIESDDKLKDILRHWMVKIGLPNRWFFINCMDLINDFKLYINNFEYFKEMLKAFDLVPIILSNDEIEQLKKDISLFDELYNKEFNKLCNEEIERLYE